MRASLTRRACAVALLVTSTLAPAVAVAAQPGGNERQSERAAVQARLLGEKIVPHKLDFQGTTVGGFSGVDRNRCTGEYVFLSDDRSQLQPARFYTAKLDVDAAGVHAVDFTGTHSLLQPDGSPYPSPSLGDGKAVDPEEIRVDPRTCDYWWAQEGDRPKAVGAGPVIQPSIQFAGPTGDYLGRLPLPSNYEITMEERGPRRNQAIEAITFGSNGRVVTSAVEGPLLQDGPVPDLENGALVRVTRQTRDGRVLGQFAYPIEKIFAPSDPASPWGPDTGVPSLLAFPDNPHRYLVLERSWVAGSGYKIRLYDATTRGATDVQARESLAGQPVVAMRKKLVADFDTLGLSTVDNTEGMTWGPELPSGERSLILVSDDNFVSDAVTQIIALAIR
ncbi:esterase-like activity of phytase family protein [Streptomyces gardneri]|uniref:esterase-like activity of phytase family protein n=1 Tax=Streptomyces gardneri TaxID=66892 RepID=UPI0006E461B4|nr:esterase-like activity of phytase family protein [Streptomyces gardneri]QPK43878.1 esterase-like activity of phytase family protein [Streptomyces gardneri]WRK35140.1 esterase-like activity of phytase family protein [Streptomyces venezuelae]